MVVKTEQLADKYIGNTKYSVNVLWEALMRHSCKNIRTLLTFMEDNVAPSRLLRFYRGHD